MDVTAADTKRAIRDAWRCAIDACLEHDCEHEQRAIAELQRLGQLPSPRPASP